MATLLHKLILGFVAAGGVRVHVPVGGHRYDPCACEDSADGCVVCPPLCYEDEGTCHLKPTHQDEPALISDFRHKMRKFLPELACHLEDEDDDTNRTEKLAIMLSDLAVISMVGRAKPGFKLLHADLRTVSDHPLSKLPMVLDLKNFKWGSCSLPAKEGRESLAVVLHDSYDSFVEYELDEKALAENVALELSVSDNINIILAMKKSAKQGPHLERMSPDNVPKVLSEIDEILATKAPTSLAENVDTAKVNPACIGALTTVTIGFIIESDEAKTFGAMGAKACR